VARTSLLPKTSVCAAIIATGFCAAAATAGAAVTIGETVPGGFAPIPCVGPALWFQTQVGGPPAYTVPAGGGVITSWSLQQATTPDGYARIKMLTPEGGGNYKVAAQGPVQSLGVGFNTLKVRIPVHAGDTLALWQAAANNAVSIIDCEFQTSDSNDRSTALFPGTEPMPGDTVNASGASKVRANISAQVEPDLDGDGYGDETQDRADLSLALTAPSRATAGSLVKYRFTVRNHGFGAAQRTVLVDRLPAHAKYIGASNPTGPCLAIPHGFGCFLGYRPKGSETTITVTARVGLRGTAIDTAHVASSTIDSRPANNLAGAATSVGCKQGFHFDRQKRKCVR